MPRILDDLNEQLEKRKREKTYRTLKNPNHGIDFTSNDYLGLATNQELKNQIDLEYSKIKQIGSTGSRLLSGNSSYAFHLETYLAKTYHAQAALLFNSGYTLNFGLMASVPTNSDLIIMDEFCHSSIRGGAKMSNATRIYFKHNNIEDLKEILKSNYPKNFRNIFVVTEGIFSMDGDLSPLPQISEICEYYDANLIVDEAHSGGVIGEKGLGLVDQYNLNQKVFARIHTFGKAFGSHGAVILCSEILKNYLINFCHSFIYATAAPLYSLIAIKEAHNFLFKNLNILTNLHENISYFNNKIGMHEHLSPIYSILCTDTDKLFQVTSELKSKGIIINPIVAPTVKKGSERLRLIIHASNTKNEMDILIHELKTLL